MSNKTLDPPAARAEGFKPEIKPPTAAQKKILREALAQYDSLMEAANFYTRSEIERRAKTNERSILQCKSFAEVQTAVEKMHTDRSLLSDEKVGRVKRFCRDSAEAATRPAAPIVSAWYEEAAAQAAQAAEAQESRDRAEFEAAGLPFQPSPIVAGLRKREAEYLRGAHGQSHICGIEKGCREFGITV